jgi:histidinol-phosphate aminotransferase
MVLPKKSLTNVQGYEPPLSIPDYILKLDLNENILGPSPKVVEVLKKITKEDIQRYPAYGELIDRIAKYNNVDRKMILPTNGADEAIKYVFDAFVDKEDTVLTVTPTFAMPEVYARVSGCNFKEIPYQQKWVFPIDKFLSSIDEKTKMIIITTPNSPTGDVIARDDLLKIINSVPESIILIDQTYCAYAEENFIDLVFKYPNVIVARSMSKDFALAGIRLGYLISEIQNINNIKKIISPFSVNNIAVKAGIAALEDVKFFNEVKVKVNKSKKILKEGLFHIAKEVYESHGNFIFADFGERAEFIYKKLLKNGIKVKFFDDGSAIQNCFRISLPAPEQSEYILEVLKSRELLIFDMDGVLVDTANSYRLAIRKTYEYFSGGKIDHEEIQQAKNQGGLNNDWDLTAHLLKTKRIEVDMIDLISKFQEYYFGNNGDGYIRNEEFLLDKDLLTELAKEYDLAIFTGRPKAEAKIALSRAGVEHIFCPVITMEDVPRGKHKPNSYGIKHILDIIQPTKAYYFGDTVDDIICAKGAGVMPVGVMPPQDKTDYLRGRFEEFGAQAVLDDIKGLKELLKTI